VFEARTFHSTIGRQELIKSCVSELNFVHSFVLMSLLFC